jgi:hypothetical protein
VLRDSRENHLHSCPKKTRGTKEKQLWERFWETHKRRWGAGGAAGSFFARGGLSSGPSQNTQGDRYQRRQGRVRSAWSGLSLGPALDRTRDAIGTSQRARVKKRGGVGNKARRSCPLRLALRYPSSVRPQGNYYHKGNTATTGGARSEGGKGREGEKGKRREEKRK